MLSQMLGWLAARFGYIRQREYARIHNGTDAIARGQRWEGFYAEEGGLQDMILQLRHHYFEASAALGIGDTDKLYEYALADRLLREFDREARTVVETGRIKASEKAFAQQSAALTR